MSDFPEQETLEYFQWDLARGIASEFKGELSSSDQNDLMEQIVGALGQARGQALDEFIAAIRAIQASEHPDKRWAEGRRFGVALAITTLQELLEPSSPSSPEPEQP